MTRTMGSGALLLSFLAVTGCGAERPRGTVHGRVTWNGSPIQHGVIRFQLADSPAVTGVIRDGRYRLEGPARMYVGIARVEIEAYEEDGTVITPGANQPTLKGSKQVLPDNFNARSALTADIRADRANEYNFDLVP